MSGRSFLYGTAVLLAANVFNRFVGFIYQIMMMRLIRPEGVGLFSMIFPVYIMMLVLASLGIPVAISKLVAEEVAVGNLSGAYRIFKISLSIIIASSSLLMVLLLLCAPLLTRHVFANPDVYPCFVSLVPGVLIVSICSAFRGFFQGLQRMSPTAVTQAIEQLVRVAAGLGIASIMLPHGIKYASLGISLGVICGELSGFLIMLYIYATRRPRLYASAFDPTPTSNVLGRIFNLGIPVTLTRFVSTALMSLDALIIPRRLLLSGMSMWESTAAFGKFVGITEALFFTPGVITLALTTALIPAVSDAMAQGKTMLLKNRIEEAVRITIMVGAPVAAVFLVLPHEMCQVFFGYASAGDALFVLALSGPFLYLHQTTTGILQGLGRAVVPFKNLVKASVFKITGIYFLTSIPGFGIQGTALSLAVGYIILACLNYRDLKKHTGISINAVSCAYKPVIAAAAAGMVMLQTKLALAGFFDAPGLPGLALTLAAGAISYLGALLFTGGINAADLSRISHIIKRS
ncbi:MAG: stage V sporulation protein B [Bacillota bacterium]